MPRGLLDHVARVSVEWEGRAIDRRALRAVPSWGASLILHGLALLMLAILMQLGGGAEGERSFTAELPAPPGELNDFTSLAEADRSGDPFTDLDDPNPPSLSFGPEDPDVMFANQPEITGLASFAPEPAGPEAPPELAPSLVGAASLGALSANVQAPFSGRSGVDRARLVRREGGTVRSEKAVNDGLEWIVRHQRPDGSWTLDVNEVCGECPSRAAIVSQTGATGLALLPLLGAGHIHTVKGPHQAAVRKGVEWLVANQAPDGDLHVGGTGTAYLYSHSIAAMALCEAYGLSRDPALRKPAERAAAFLVASQDAGGGGWRYRPGQEGDTSVFGWSLFALRSANLAGIPIPKKTVQRCTNYLNSAAFDRKRILYSYQPGQSASPVMTAEALVGRQLLGWGRDHPALARGAARVASHLQTSEDRNIYYWYYATQLLHNMRNKDWERWNPHVREALIDAQIHEDGCGHGSWDPAYPSADRWGMSAGRLYQTSLSILTLEVYYRYLPLYRTADEEGMDAPPGPAEVEAKAEGVD